ncbi:hypothetical protein [Sphingomicrobium aestuariivivum]|uniref:hypothetical protein n=1 Tax=Sphingomicrobium aestuariivivum TaxID=1582356 RepID=UPI001FD686BD|nr:hypothetical protein [Sphingomicrobium aestuariivivum]MCJ8189795.1 hypothetical protein [Sphingomicrobium aestuariivivum]
MKTSDARLALLLMTAPAVMLVAPAPLAAQDGSATAEANAEADIVIVGMTGKPFRLDSDRLRDAVRTFEKHHERYAPQARFYWQVVDHDPASDMALELVERRSGERVPLVIAPDGTFTLPHDRILERKHDLTANRLKKSLRIRPMLFSPGGSEERHRLGDARLWCRVMLAFTDNDMGIGTRLVLGAVGGCNSSRVNFMRSTGEPIESVSLSGSDEPLAIAEDRMAYRMPVHLRDLGDEEIITVNYSAPREPALAQ